MVRLNVIYTRTGDQGETGLGDGSRRPKTDPRFAAMGDVDETNSAVGLARLVTRGSSDPALALIDETLARESRAHDWFQGIEEPGRLRTAFWRIPSVRGPSRERQLRVALTRSTHDSRTTGFGVSRPWPRVPAKVA
jgi:hypothetical protein